jgi:3'(2'), 5'-bisphosphate nucleotidase
MDGMHAHEVAALAEALLPVALAAARVQLGHFRRGVAVERKPDRSPVTVADRESEEVILEGLARIAPGVAVVAEEQRAAGKVPALSGSFFLVDPLDGTKGFIAGRPEFTINIALVANKRPVFGLLYAPALNDFSITLGPKQAAHARLAPHADVHALADCGLRTIHSRSPDLQALCALTSQSHLTPETERVLEGYGVATRRALSSSLKFALLARGEADLYPRMGPTCEWDTAAGHALLAAAGGSVTTLEGKPLRYGNAERGFENAPFIAWGREPLPRRQAGVKP